MFFFSVFIEEDAQSDQSDDIIEPDLDPLFVEQNDINEECNINSEIRCNELYNSTNESVVTNGPKYDLVSKCQKNVWTVIIVILL